MAHIPSTPVVPSHSPDIPRDEFDDAPLPHALYEDEDEPVMVTLGGLRSLSVSYDPADSDLLFADGSESKRGERPPPTTASKRQRGSDFDDETLLRLAHSTPPKVSPVGFGTGVAFFADVTPPTPPRRPSYPSNNSSPESPTVAGLAARRAASGKLPNKALVSLQQMSFDASGADMGLGVGPGSPGFEGCMEGVSPGPGMTFRIALGLSNGKDVDTPSPSDDSENVFGASSTTNLASPSLLRYPSSSSSKRRSTSSCRTPPSPGFLASEPVKIPPTLRGSKILEKLNLSSPPMLTSPLSVARGDRPAPPSPLILRSSAFTFSNTGPLTPLTPSHIPGAPNLNGGAGFDWFSYSMPDSPNTPAPLPQRFIAPDSGLSPRQAFFLPTPPSDSGRSPRSASNHLVGSPLSRRPDPLF
ncbi:hypothetical protein P7C70_g619, partial [Phenoliferia sp. Uapishka_3]